MNLLGIGAKHPACIRWSGFFTAGCLTLGVLLAACSGETCATGASRALVLRCGQSLRDHFLDPRCPFYEEVDLRQAGLSAIRELIPLIGDGDARLRSRASAVLPYLAPIPGQAEVAHALLGALPRERDAGVKINLVLAMSSLPSQAARVSPAIRALISAQEENLCVRMAAAYGHWRLTLEETAAAELFAWALSAENSEVHEIAAHYLAEMGTFPRLLVKEVAAGLSHPVSQAKYCFAVALGNVGPEAIGATGSLEPLLDDRSGLVRDAAHSALCKIHEGYMRPEWSRGR